MVPPCDKCSKPYRSPLASFCAACGHKRPHTIKPLVISFDLDDTLIPGAQQFSTEPITFWQKIRRGEMIRKGTIELFKTLQAKGHKVYIYTTSLRTELNIRSTFSAYGLHPDKIINRTRHEKELSHPERSYSKYPPAFGIDIHVDDSDGVAIEGRKYNFNTIIVKKDTPDWTNYILAKVAEQSRIFYETSPLPVPPLISMPPDNTVHYFKRHWNETSGEDDTDSWGTSTFVFETNGTYEVLRQIQLFENGMVLKYDTVYTHDKFGGLSEVTLDEKDFEEYKIDANEFEQLWAKTHYRQHPEIVCTPEVLWGQPRLERRRLGVYDIVGYVQHCNNDLSAKQFPLQ